MEDGLKMLKDAENAGEPFNLIITDMHFPMRSGSHQRHRSGRKISSDSAGAGKSKPTLSYVPQEIVKLPGVYGCIWYSEISDWEEELCDLVREMEKVNDLCDE
ncbi:MAG: hypothetical protein ACLRIL_10440 [Fusicatenibacter saccharivorans]